MPRYWVVSANVNDKTSTRARWIETILRNKSAYMGWSAEYEKGRKLGKVFARISAGDVVLIARGPMLNHGADRKLVACGRVLSNHPKRDKRVTDLGHSQFAPLEPFKELDEDPSRSGISFKNTPYDGSPKPPAVYELSRADPYHPGSAKLCGWLDRKLAQGKLRIGHTKKKASTSVTAHTIETPGDPNPEGYDFRTKIQRIRAIRREGKLVGKFRLALERQGRKAVICVYSAVPAPLRCDLYEEKKRHLIEAKATSDREDVRMAIGQLFDYRYLAKKAGQGKSKLAVLLPQDRQRMSSSYSTRSESPASGRSATGSRITAMEFSCEPHLGFLYRRSQCVRYAAVAAKSEFSADRSILSMHQLKLWPCERALRTERTFWR